MNKNTKWIYDYDMIYTYSLHIDIMLIFTCIFTYLNTSIIYIYVLRTKNTTTPRSHCKKKHRQAPQKTGDSSPIRTTVPPQSLDKIDLSFRDSSPHRLGAFCRWMQPSWRLQGDKVIFGRECANWKTYCWGLQGVSKKSTQINFAVAWW